LRERVRLEIYLAVEAGGERPECFPEQIVGYTVALPKLESVLAGGGLVGDAAEDESAIAAQVIVLIEGAATFEGQIRRIHKILVKGIEL
jgi:hypothetical protein